MKTFYIKIDHVKTNKSVTTYYIKKEFFTLNGNCQAGNIVYEATITCNEQNYGEHSYKGIAETTFIKRCGSHKWSNNLAITRMILNFWNNFGK